MKGLAQHNVAIAKTLIRKKQYEEAQAILEEASTVYPGHPELPRLLGQVKDGLTKSYRKKSSKKIPKWQSALGGFVIVIFVLALISNFQEEKKGATPTQQRQIIIQPTEALASESPSVANLPSATVRSIDPTQTSTITIVPTALTVRDTFAKETSSPTKTSGPTYTPSATPTLSMTPSATRTSSPTATKTVSPTYTLSNTPVYASVVGSDINARNCPSTACDIVRVITSREDFIVLGSYDDWYWVEFDNQQRAFIFSQLIGLPQGAEVSIAPTLTSSPPPTSTSTRTPTVTRTATSRPTATRTPSPTPLKFDEETVLLLIKYTMEITDNPIDSDSGEIRRVSRECSRHSQFQSRRDYSISDRLYWCLGRCNIRYLSRGRYYFAAATARHHEFHLRQSGQHSCEVFNR